MVHLRGMIYCYGARVHSSSPASFRDTLDRPSWFRKAGDLVSNWRMNCMLPQCKECLSYTKRVQKSKLPNDYSLNPCLFLNSTLMLKFLATMYRMVIVYQNIHCGKHYKPFCLDILMQLYISTWHGYYRKFLLTYFYFQYHAHRAANTPLTVSWTRNPYENS